MGLNNYTSVGVHCFISIFHVAYRTRPDREGFVTRIILQSGKFGPMLNQQPVTAIPLKIKQTMPAI